MLYSSLRAAGLPVFPCWVQYDRTRNKWEKGPAVPRGTSWKTVAGDSSWDRALDWSSEVVGIMVPSGILIIDLDSYKGSTRGSVEKHFGCALPWDRAKIQETIGGGEHYAFQVPPDVELRQMSAADGGFDTRVAGKGFVCSGRGYTPSGMGVFALSQPGSLPPLPEPALSTLSIVRTAPAAAPEPAGAPMSDIQAALTHIDPGCSRAQWVRIGCALRDAYRDTPDQGLEVFRRWSEGALWRDGCPDNHDPGVIDSQWNSFKPEGGVHRATLYYAAIQGGWRPPASFDAAAAFGAQAANPNAFNQLVERIRRDGHDIKLTEAILREVQAAGCNPLQTRLLTSELKTELGNRRDVNKALDQTAEPRAPGNGDGYGASDVENSDRFLSTHYPGNRLQRNEGDIYHYDGQIWCHLDPDLLSYQISADMKKQLIQNNKINACIDLTKKLIPVIETPMNRENRHLIVYQNGILNTYDGQLYPHSQLHLSTVLLPYNYEPQAECPQWLYFLNDVLAGDQESIALLQEWIGYMLTVDYSHHKIMIMVGPRRCGKGTIGRIIKSLVGETNFFGGSLDSFARDSFIDALRSRSILFIGDAEKRLAKTRHARIVERIKSISGHDAIDFDRKFKTTLSSAIPTRITIAANSVPAMFDDSGALASRMLVIPFRRTYLDREDLGLFDRLSTELSGIANWALAGMHRLRQQGRFTTPAASTEEQMCLHENFSPVLRFIEERCVFGPEHRVTSKRLYEVFRVWCLDESEETCSRRAFTSSFRDATRTHSLWYGTARINGEPQRGFIGVGEKQP